MAGKAIVVGIGNPLRADDSVGLRVARTLKDHLEPLGITVVEASVSGMDLVEMLIGYDRALLVDAIQTEGGAPGQVLRITPEALRTGRLASASHTLDLTSALDLGRKLGMALPNEVIIFAIEVADMESFTEECTPEVARAVPVCAEMVVRELGVEAGLG